MDPLPLAVCLLLSYRTRDFHPLDYTHAGRPPYPAAPDCPLFRGQNRFLCFLAAASPQIYMGRCPKVCGCQVKNQPRRIYGFRFKRPSAVKNFFCHVSSLFEIAFCVKFVILFFESWPESVSSSDSKASQFLQEISPSFNDFPQIGQVVIIETPLLYIE